MGGGEDLDDDAVDKDEGKFVIHSFQHYSMHATIICWNYSLNLKGAKSWFLMGFPVLVAENDDSDTEEEVAAEAAPAGGEAGTKAWSFFQNVLLNSQHTSCSFNFKWMFLLEKLVLVGARKLEI